jgi:hypothetical protein
MIPVIAEQQEHDTCHPRSNKNMIPTWDSSIDFTEMVGRAR